MHGTLELQEPVTFPGFTLPAGTRVRPVPGGQLTERVAVRVTAGPAGYVGRVVHVPTVVLSQAGWECVHGRPGDRPWECWACVLAAAWVGPALGIQDLRGDPPAEHRSLYFEKAIELWAAMVENRYGRMAVELWLAHQAGVPWEAWCAERAAEAEQARLDDEDPPEPPDYDPGPEVDDQGGMSEWRRGWEQSHPYAEEPF